jgi:hypothetical protein
VVRRGVLVTRVVDVVCHSSPALTVLLPVAGTVHSPERLASAVGCAHNRGSVLQPCQAGPRIRVVEVIVDRSRGADGTVSYVAGSVLGWAGRRRSPAR